MKESFSFFRSDHADLVFEEFARQQLTDEVSEEDNKAGSATEE